MYYGIACYTLKQLFPVDQFGSMLGHLNECIYFCRPVIFLNIELDSN